MSRINLNNEDLQTVAEFNAGDSTISITGPLCAVFCKALNIAFTQHKLHEKTRLQTGIENHLETEPLFEEDDVAARIVNDALQEEANLTVHIQNRSSITQDDVSQISARANIKGAKFYLVINDDTTNTDITEGMSSVEKVDYENALIDNVLNNSGHVYKGRFVEIANEDETEQGANNE